MTNLKKISALQVHDRDDRAIVRYLSGEMSDKEMVELEIRNLNDPDFYKKFKEMKLLISGIKQVGASTDQETKIRKLAEKSGATSLSHLSKFRRLSPRKKAALAFGFGLLLLAMTFALFRSVNPAPMSSQELYATYFKVSPNIGLQTSRGTGAPAEAVEAYGAYDRRDYEAAIAKFESMIPTSSRRMTDLFHLGNCYLATDDPQKAVTALEEVANSNSRLADEAKWYLALAYLRLDKSSQAKTLLEEVATPIDRRKMAKKIQQKLPDQ